MSSLSALNLFNVKGRVALVTGGSSGLGLMICNVSGRKSMQLLASLNTLVFLGTRYQWGKSLPCSIAN